MIGKYWNYWFRLCFADRHQNEDVEAYSIGCRK